MTYDFLFLILRSIILDSVSSEYNRWVVEIQLGQLRHMSDTPIERDCAIFRL